MPIRELAKRTRNRTGIGATARLTAARSSERIAFDLDRVAHAHRGRRQVVEAQPTRSGSTVGGEQD